MKNIKVYAIICTIIITGVLGGCSKKQDSPTQLEPLFWRKNVVMDTHTSVAPFEFTSQNGVVDNLNGINIEVGNQIAKDLNKTFTINNVSLQSVIVEVASERADFGIATGVFSTKDNKDNLDFSSPFYVSKAQVLVKQTSSIKAYNTFKDALVGVVKNYKEASVVKNYAKSNNITIKEYDKASDAVDALKNGKLDAVVFEQAAASHYQSKNQDLRVVDIPEYFPVDNYVVAVKKGNTDLLNKINDSIKKMTENKAIENFVVKYYS